MIFVHRYLYDYLIVLIKYFFRASVSSSNDFFGWWEFFSYESIILIGINRKN